MRTFELSLALQSSTQVHIVNAATRTRLGKHKGIIGVDVVAGGCSFGKKHSQVRLQLLLAAHSEPPRLQQQVPNSLPLGHGNVVQCKLKRHLAVGQSLVPLDALDGLERSLH